MAESGVSSELGSRSDIGGAAGEGNRPQTGSKAREEQPAANREVGGYDSRTSLSANDAATGSARAVTG